MRHKPARTCIGCRGVFAKNEVVRIVSGPVGIAIDYNEKLPGRAAYVCPKEACIHTAFGRGNLSRALRERTELPTEEVFIARLKDSIAGKIKSLIAMSAKAGKLAAGYSAVQDALEKGRVEVLVYARDISEGTKAKLSIPGELRQETLFTRDEFGRMLCRELVGVIGIEDKGLADALVREVGRLKGLINTGK